MTLVDTSVWIDHLRSADPTLTTLLVNGTVCCHPFVVGELACGGLKRRDEILGLLKALPQAPLVDQEEVLEFLEANVLMAGGLGWIDIHLLAAVRLGGDRLLTKDRRLGAAARRLGVAA